MNADPASRAHYDKQRAHRKTHTQALLRLARLRISVLFAMLRDGTFYESRAKDRRTHRINPTPTNHLKPGTTGLTNPYRGTPRDRSAHGRKRMSALSCSSHRAWEEPGAGMKRHRRRMRCRIFPPAAYQRAIKDALPIPATGLEDPLGTVDEKTVAMPVSA